MFQNPFSFNGRIRRTEYGISILLYYFIFFSLVFLIGLGEDRESNSLLPLIFLVVLIPMVWFQLAQGAKRCHDLGNSGWWQLIPFYGLWMIFENGENRTNRYGANPKYVSTFTTAATVKPPSEY